MVSLDFETDFPVLHTKRMTLRKITVGDAEDLLSIFGNDAVAEFLDGPTLTSIEQVQEIISWADKIYVQGSGLRWGIQLNGQTNLIGTIGFHLWSKPNSRAEIGYELSQHYWQQGIMTDALTEILKYGFEEMALNRIEAHTLPNNHASIALLKKAGFQREGILREYEFYRERYNDTLVLSLLRRDWKQAAG